MSLAEQYTNLATSTLNGAYTSGGTSITVTSASTFPTTGQFRIIIDSEIMLVTAVSGATFTVTGAQEGTSAANHSNGATVTHGNTAAVMKRFPTRGRAYAAASGNFLF